MRNSFSNDFRLFVSRSLSIHSPIRLAIISSTIITSLFAAITGPCMARYISLTGDFDLYERMLFYILNNHDCFPVLEEIFYHCSPPLSYSTCYTYYYIPTSFQPPVHLPATLRTIALHLNIPIWVHMGQDREVRRFHLTWDLCCPNRSKLHARSTD